MRSFHALSTLLLWLMISSLHTELKAEGLSPEQERTVRDAVYKGELLLASRDPDNFRVLDLPEPLQTLYKKHPQSVVNLLLVIADGAKPRDSVLAVGYAFELIEGPGAGVVCIEMFEAKMYDLVDMDWTKSPRNHWIGKVRVRLVKDEAKPKDQPTKPNSH